MLRPIGPIGATFSILPVRTQLDHHKAHATSCNRICTWLLHRRDKIQCSPVEPPKKRIISTKTHASNSRTSLYTEDQHRNVDRNFDSNSHKCNFVCTPICRFLVLQRIRQGSAKHYALEEAVKYFLRVNKGQNIYNVFFYHVVIQ